MSFSDEVDAARAARSLPDPHASAEREKPEVDRLPLAAIAFRDEIRALWEDAEKYWRTNNMVDAALAHWVEQGRYRNDLSGKVSLPFPGVQTFIPGRARAFWEFAPTAPLELLAAQQGIERFPGLAINDWFAICAPGELRELLSMNSPVDFDETRDLLISRGQGLKGQLVAGLRRSYFQHAGAPEPQGAKPDDQVSWMVEFEGPGKQPNVKLIRDINTPIEVFSAQRGQWTSEGTLRGLVVGALAKRMG